MSDNPFAVDNPIYEPDWEKGSQEAVKRLQNQPLAKEKSPPLPQDYEEVIQIVDNRVESYIAERQIPDYLVDKDIRDAALDTMSKGEVGQLREATRKLSGSTDLGHMLTQAQEVQNLSDISKEKISTVVQVRNFLAYEDVVDFATRVNNLALAKHLTTEQALNKVLEGSRLDRKQVAKKFIYAVNSGSYKRLKTGEVPEERRDREDSDTYPTVKFIGSILRPQIEEVKKEVEHKKEEKRGRFATQPIEDPGVRLADYNYLYNFIYAGDKETAELREAVEDNSATPAQVLELAERYTRAIQSEEYGRKLNINPSGKRETVNYTELQDIRNGYDALNRYLINSVGVIKGQDLTRLKEAYDQAISSRWLNNVSEDEARPELGFSRLSRQKILSWFETLKTLFEPPKKSTPPFRISLR